MKISRHFAGKDTCGCPIQPTGDCPINRLRCPSTDWIVRSSFDRWDCSAFGWIDAFVLQCVLLKPCEALVLLGSRAQCALRAGLRVASRRNLGLRFGSVVDEMLVSWKTGTAYQRLAARIDVFDGTQGCYRVAWVGDSLSALERNGILTNLAVPGLVLD